MLTWTRLMEILTWTRFSLSCIFLDLFLFYRLGDLAFSWSNVFLTWTCFSLVDIVTWTHLVAVLTRTRLTQTRLTHQYSCTLTMRSGTDVRMTSPEQDGNTRVRLHFCAFIQTIMNKMQKMEGHLRLVQTRGVQVADMMHL